MKKCASCTKDLPDAALHCVFCGAKQPPAPAVQQSMAKTAFGYQGNEVQEAAARAAQARSQAALGTAATAVPPPPLPIGPARSAGPLAHAATQAVPAYQGGSQPFTPGAGLAPPASAALAGMSPTLAPEDQQSPFAAPRAPAAGRTDAVPPTLVPGDLQSPFAAPRGMAAPLPPPPSPYQPPAQPFPSPAQAYPPPQSFQPPAPAYQPPVQPFPAPAQAYPPPGVASNAGAATLFVAPAGPPAAPGPAPQGMFGRAAPQSPTIVPGALQPIPGAVPAGVQTSPAPQMPAPMAIPAAMPSHYQTSPTATNVRRPADPWRDSLRAMMFIWGVLLLIAFATPLATKPDLLFSWKLILDGEGMARLPPLTLAAVGLLSTLLAFVPMPTAARGMIAALLGLAGLAVPIAIVGMPPWQVLVPIAGAVLLLPGLIIRSEYLASLLPRVLVTLGVIGMLVTYLLPQNDTIPLVALIKQLIDVPGSAKVHPGLELGLILVVVMSLLAWLPSPATGGAKVWAWLIILWPLFGHIAGLLLKGGIGDRVSAAPNEVLVGWIAQGPAYLVLIAYGLAAVFGKRLE